MYIYCFKSFYVGTSFIFYLHCINLSYFVYIQIAIKGFLLSTCADDTHVVYVDGKQVNSNFEHSDFNQAISTSIPINTSIIAVHVTNLYDLAGFKAVSADGSIVSDSSWKCTSILMNGWQNIEFDDSSWPAPVVSKNLANCKGFSPSALWLWTEETFSSVNSMYCRKTVRRNV